MRYQCDAASGKGSNTEEKHRGKWGRGRVNGSEWLENSKGENAGAQAHNVNFGGAATAPQFISFQGCLGNNDPTQIAPKPIATVT